MHVAATDPARMNSDENLARSRARDGYFAQFEMALLSEEGGSHGAFPETPCRVSILTANRKIRSSEEQIVIFTQRRHIGVLCDLPVILGRFRSNRGLTTPSTMSSQPAPRAAPKAARPSIRHEGGDS